MLSPMLLTVTLLYGIALGNPLDYDLDKRTHATTTACNANNCLRVMTNTPSVASSFCSTWLQPTVYVTVTPTVTVSGSSTISSAIPTTTVGPVIPSHISSQCSLTTAPPLTSRLSSACSCISVVPAAGTVTLTSYAPATTTTVPLPCLEVTSPYTTNNGKIFDTTCSGSVAGAYNSYSTGITSFQQCIDTAQYGPAKGVKFLTADQNAGVAECFIYTDPSTVFSDGEDAIAVIQGYTPEPLPCLAVSNPYTANGETFDVICSVYYTGPLITRFLGTIPDLGSCITSCATTANCVAINWQTAHQAGVTYCALLSSINKNYGQARITVAVLEGYTSPSYP